MTWESERLKSGRRLVRIVEVELDFCQLTYGNSPCAAVLGFSGDHKCFNTRETCQDPPNYDPATKTYRFSDSVEGLPRTLNAIPSLLSIDMAPTVIDPGRSLGKRASISVTFQDHPHHDRGIDNYASDRISGVAAADGSTYTPYEQGTFFGKLRARNPFYVGRKLHVLSGYIPWDYNAAPDQQPAYTQAEVLANMRRRTYVMDRWEGPDANGRFTITAKDILKLADDSRSECPVQSTGRLDADITAGDGSATLRPSGIGDEEYSASGTLLIGTELMTFTRSGDTLTLTARGSDNTDAAAHNEDDVVQECKRFSSVRVDSIIQDLLENFAGVDSSFIPISDWNDEAATWLSGHTFSTVIAEPAGVATLISELCEQSLVYLWWHEIDQEIKLRAIRPQTSGATVTGDNAILESEFSRDDRQEDRLTRVVVRFDRISPVHRLDDPDSFLQALTAADTDAEGANEYGEKRVRRIFSRWLGSTNRGQALQLANRILARFRDGPVEYEFVMGAKDASLWTGDVFTIQHRLAQGFRGEEKSERVQAIEVEELAEGQFRYTCIADLFGNRYAVIGPDTLPVYSNATQEERESYAFISPDSGVFADGSAAYRII